VEDFRHARRQANLQQVVARLTGKSAELLSYEDVRQKLKAMELSGEELKEIPLDAIVGSVGRYTDFTRGFLPRQDSDEGRWARVKVAMTDMRGVPPIQVYQIGQAYFVQDGNHRVSIARRLGATHIEAYVTQVQTKVPLSPDIQSDDLILKAEYTEFLEHTCLDELRPEADLSVTAPGQYQVLEEHIEVHRYFMGLEQEREIPYTEAVAHWYDEVYLPVVWVIRERGILRDFPGRTETDLYLWTSEHRATLMQELGWEIDPKVAATDLSVQLSPRPQRVAARVGGKVMDAVMPDELEAGPPPGQWRKEHVTARQDDRLFADILVAVNGEESGWYALEYTLEIARREGARLHGLHVTPLEAKEKGQEVQAVQAEFDRRCQETDVTGDLALESGKVQRRVCDRAPLTDLVVLSLSYPPAPQPMARLGSGLRTIIQRCPRPVLAVPEGSPPLDRVLLAYDGSPKADEALFIATYVANRWNIPLTIVTVIESGRTTSDTLERAQSYLETHKVQATIVKESGSVAEAILKAAKEHASDLIIMGGYGFSPVLEVVLGSTVDHVLSASQRPVLICR
jgi:nucleotide-binding universal stress UspA family protein